ncbi:MAG: ABC transporter permease [candidate division Zixibacteria bacterium]|nr:ABC transporter permease [candidate division Zixibacteria bacterium]
MDYAKVTSVSIESLLSHKIRTFLTMLGIIFGVAAVIAMLSIGEGAKQDALEQIEVLGMSNIIVEGVIPGDDGGSDIVGGRSPGLKISDAENLALFTGLFDRIVISQILDEMTVYYSDKDAASKVIATSPSYLATMNLTMKEGIFIRPIDIEDNTQVCAIGTNIKSELFSFSDAIGKQIRIQDLYFTIIGVVDEKSVGSTSIEGMDIGNINDNIYIPISVCQKKIYRSSDYAASRSGMGNEAELQFNRDEIDQIVLKVKEGQDITTVAALVEDVMSRRHREVPDFKVIIPEALLAQSQATQRIFNIVMGAIAGISLLVGGIGIMNIMLASVLERTREIGIRRAVGASQMDIMSQFLIEAVMICLIGCIIGVGAGLGLAKGISTYADWRTIISYFSIFLAVGVSTAVGLVFGFFPAKKAAALDVIESLRYE